MIRNNRTPNWMAMLAVLGGLFVGLPWLAPMLRHWGWVGGANVIYFIYSFVCHQLPERSYFLFGEKFTYSLTQIQAVWPEAGNPMLLRQFIGTTTMGWKVAWSDRMVSMYTSLWLSLVVGWALRRRLPALPVWGLILLTLPMALDGTSHLLSDLAGIERGFREYNLWLVALTANRLAPAFYSGDTWGTFNSLMRLVTGILFGSGIGWFSVPYLTAFEVPAVPSGLPRRPDDLPPNVPPVRRAPA